MRVRKSQSCVRAQIWQPALILFHTVCFHSVPGLTSRVRQNCSFFVAIDGLDRHRTTCTMIQTAIPSHRFSLCLGLERCAMLNREKHFAKEPVARISHRVRCKRNNYQPYVQAVIPRSERLCQHRRTHKQQLRRRDSVGFHAPPTL